MKSLWEVIKRRLNKERTVRKYSFVNSLIRGRYTYYINERRCADSVYRYMSLLKKSGYITSNNTHYILVRHIPIDLKVTEARINRAGFFKKEDFEL